MGELERQKDRDLRPRLERKGERASCRDCEGWEERKRETRREADRDAGR